MHPGSPLTPEVAVEGAEHGPVTYWQIALQFLLYTVLMNRPLQILQPPIEETCRPKQTTLLLQALLRNACFS